ncbi:uncharacterized protein CTHT_0000820 [Thermochaetoides thermophila DSM 1495]|uniref:Major facilitator superfamily (MFS) profile domain-containing protein n=1 Tax=Chaetomium thermophilum (strain DSM 1495 / CBS 144.50 / IMI 039719) TaxID=759272 RepID=G0RYW6_CHATD|nr:hypothetical protein CTHT_0000820 [Thermochaetoides thermophila DSM 1495]EGS23394.1 hypothetical protein CTHT_0000820 [Thermochaetoides thermophila DSM 1495]
MSSEPQPSLLCRLLSSTGLQALYQIGLDAHLIILSRSSRMLAYGGSSLILALFFSSLHVPDARIGLFMTLTLAGDVALSLGLALIADRVGRRRILKTGSVLMILSGVVFALCENYWVLLGAAILGVISATGGDFGPFRAIEESVVSGLAKKEERTDVLVWCELKPAGTSEGDEERRPLLNESQNDDSSSSGKHYKSWISRISRETLSIMSILWFLLMVDSLADGMANMSLTSYYLDQKFSLLKSVLGNIVSTSYLLAAVATIFASPLSRALGLVNTMVFTHIPSSAAVLLFPLPRGVVITFALLLVRMGLNNMDQAPRAALIAATVRPDERTAVMGITGMLRTLASTTGPIITGVLAEGGNFWAAFVVAGALRLAYDVGLFAMFINIKLHKDEEDESS